MNLYEIYEKIVNKNPDRDVEIDNPTQEQDKRIFCIEPFNWYALEKDEYEKIEKKIEKMHIKGEGYEIYVSYDMSGYERWTKKQQEHNYMQVTIYIDDDFEGDDETIAKIVREYDEICYKCSEIQCFNEKRF